ncbi:hypothetical protein BH09VER1_BH09VER1_32750 [soil metagenome]
MIWLTGCASPPTWTKQRNSPLPIEVHQSGSGRVMSWNAHETADRLTVSGSAKRNLLSNRAHVDVLLVGTDGLVIAEKKDAINPLHPAPGGGKRFVDSYVLSFPLSEARQAAKIRVNFHSGTH